MNTQENNIALDNASKCPHNDELALYVHIPFCETKCPYCDFNTYAGIESLVPSYIRALQSEIRKWGMGLHKPRLKSVFLGGGTPSYLPTRDIDALINSIGKYFEFAANCEVTLEANPGDCTRERLAAIRKSGFNRISIGVQSLDDQELKLLGRRHTAEEAKRAVYAASEAGFSNISADLIFGLPYQPVSSWEHTLESTVALPIDHLSAYCLTLEEGTPLEIDVKFGKIQQPDNDIGATMYDLATVILKENGFEQYEISNWAKSNMQSVHNLTYWNCQPYLGVGPGAHSYLWANGISSLSDLSTAGIRFETVKSPRIYIDKVTSWEPLAGEGSLTTIQNAPSVGKKDSLMEKTAVSDFLMMGLRLNSGLSDQLFSERFNSRIRDWIPGSMQECIDLGLIEWAGEFLRLTDYGRPLANEALTRFIKESSSR